MSGIPPDPELATLKAAIDLVSRHAPQESAVNGHSMVPTLRDGDCVTIEPLGTTPLVRGDVVAVAATADNVFIHRVVRVGKGLRARGYVMTRGDALAVCDRPVRTEQIVGRVRVQHSPPVRTAVQTAWTTVAELACFASLHVSPWLARMVVRLTRRITRITPGVTVQP